MVHNLRLVAWDKLDIPEYGYDWAIEANSKFKALDESGDFKSLINYASLGREVQLAIPTPDHYLPLFYSLALKEKDRGNFLLQRQTRNGLANHDFGEDRMRFVYDSVFKA